MIKLSKEKVLFIAEIGLNHNGSYDLAQELIEKSIEAGANVIKFQIRNLKNLYSKKKINSFGLGAQYIFDVINNFDLQVSQYEKLFSIVEKKGAIPLCTPFDSRSLDFLIKKKFNAFKISSSDLINLDLIKKAGENSELLILSTGMHTEDQIIKTNKFLKKNNFNSVFLHCNSTYPTPFKDINLNYLKRLKRITSSTYIGYSGHERGYHVPIAAIALGANVIEKHITINKGMEGPDHKVSLLPSEFKSMVRMSEEVLISMGLGGPKKNLTQGEIINKESLSKSFYAKFDIRAGKKIKESDLILQSPAVGLDYSFKKKIIGSLAKRNKKSGDPFELLDINKKKSKRKFKFKRKFGLPVRYHDYKSLLKGSNLDFLEFHLSYKDMNLNINNIFNHKINSGLIVHSPDLFQNDHILNLADKNAERSIYELQRVINLTSKISKFFNEKNPKIVASIGGYTRDKKASKNEIRSMIKNLNKNLKKLDYKNTVLLAQTLPPYPWYIGGQMYCNLFTTPNDIYEICLNTKLSICLDLSHTKLSANEFNFDIEDFLKLNGKFVDHLHLVDAKDHNSEGIQIGSGEINWKKTIRLLNRYSPDASFIPEIWQGHLNEGQGFWEALEKLSDYNL